MAEAQLQQFLEKVRQLNAFVALSEADPALRRALRDCAHHDEVVALAHRCGFEIGRRWGEGPASAPAPIEPPLPPPLQPDNHQQAPAEPRVAEPADPPAALADPVLAQLQLAAVAGAVEAPGEGIARSRWDRAAAAWAEAPAAASRAAALLQAGQALPLLAGDCPPAGEERSTVLLNRPQLRLERIHSCQAVSPQGFWYDQPETEWVLLLQGSARLRFADEAADRQLHPGDSLWIAAHRRHRVTATDAAPGSIWLALFWRES